MSSENAYDHLIKRIKVPSIQSISGTVSLSVSVSFSVSVSVSVSVFISVSVLNWVCWSRSRSQSPSLSRSQPLSLSWSKCQSMAPGLLGLWQQCGAVCSLRCSANSKPFDKKTMKYIFFFDVWDHWSEADLRWNVLVAPKCTWDTKNPNIFFWSTLGLVPCPSSPPLVYLRQPKSHF